MVNSKNVAFKVNKQVPVRGPPPQPFGTVINCRKPTGKRAINRIQEVRSQQVPLSKVPGVFELEPNRKRGIDDVGDDDNTAPSKRSSCSRDNSPAIIASPGFRPEERIFPTLRPRAKPTKLRRGKALSKEIDLDCWFTILRFADPAQLLEMRDKIASCYRFLRDNPTLWKHSRKHYYKDSLPEPPAELTEFQYAHLRHGHGCMSCGAIQTRKTYWAFLRRWCKNCLQKKTIKETEARDMFKDDDGGDISFISKCLPSGIFDSWGNFVGVGPAHAHSLKTVFLVSDVEKLVAQFNQEARDNPGTWHAEMRTWMNEKVKLVEQRREFAQKMEQWEDSARSSKSFDYQGRKEARKTFFVEKAAQLTPPICLREMELCPAYRRSVAIPKEPNMTSWLQLKPKLEKEAAELAANGGRPLDSMRSTPTVTTTTDLF